MCVCVKGNDEPPRKPRRWKERVGVANAEKKEKEIVVLFGSDVILSTPTKAPRPTGAAHCDLDSDYTNTTVTCYTGRVGPARRHVSDRIWGRQVVWAGENRRCL